MSRSRRIKRKKEAVISRLTELLGDFYDFMGSQPQPSDEKVRSVFLYHVKKWTEICIKNELDEKSKDAFKTEVSKVWEQKKQQIDKI